MTGGSKLLGHWVPLTWMMSALLLCTAIGSVQGKPAVEVVPSVLAGAIRSVGFSPDGGRLVSGTDDGGIMLWDVKTGARLRSFGGDIPGSALQTNAVESVAFSPNGEHVISGSKDQSAKLWDVLTGALFRTFGKPDRSVQSVNSPHGVYSVAFSTKGDRVVMGHDGVVKTFDVSTGALLRTFEGHKSHVWSVAFSPNGTSVLSGSADGTIKLWDGSTGALVRTFEGHGRIDGKWGSFSVTVTSVAFSPDGTSVLSGSWDETIRLWDAATGALLRTFEGHSGWVTSVAFSPDGRRVASGSADKTVKLWDASTGALLRTLEGHTGEVRSVVFSPDGRHVASGSSDQIIKLWDASTGALLRSFGRPSNWGSSVAFSPDGTRVLSAAAPPDINLVELWNASTGAVLGAFPGEGKGSVAFSPDGRRFALGSVDVKDGLHYPVLLREIATGTLLHTVGGHAKEVTSVAFSPAGSHLLSGSEDKTVKLWDAATGALLRTFEGHSDWVTSVTFSPDGTRVLSGSGDETIRLWDAATGALLRTFEGHSSWITSVAFSPDGRQVASGGGKTIKLWDVATGALLRTFAGNSRGITSVAFSPHGRRLVSASEDGTIKYWEVETSRLLATSIVLDNDWLAMTPDGFFLGSARSADKGLHVVRGLEAYDIEQMYQALFNPDLVRESLAGDPDGEVKKATAVLDLEKVLDSGEAPRVVLVSPAKEGTSKDELIRAEARITDVGGGIGRVEWRVNGVTVGVVSNAPGSGKERNVTQPLALEPGENTIEVVAYNGRNLLSSLPVSTRVTWNAPADQPRPRLFVIAVGINDYGDRVFRRLSHAVDDAKVIRSVMNVVGAGLYSDVDVTYVLDGDATAAGLEKMISDVGAKMHSRDVFVFFAAAHGKSENGRFHLIPQDYRSVPGRPITAGTIGQEQLQDWFVNRIKARRGLILLDTCESGALVASRSSGVDLGNSEAAIGRLNEATGRPVLTAAAADQVALEGYDGHGVFTYALLDALVEGDTNNDGKIELSELVAHVQALAPKLSQKIRGGRGQAVAQKQASRAAIALGDAPLASRYADYRQKPRVGWSGEDFPLVQSLPAAIAAAAGLKP